MHLRSNSDSRPGVVLSITGFSKIPPPLLGPVVDIAMRTPRLVHGPLHSDRFSPVLYSFNLTHIDRKQGTISIKRSTDAN